MRLGRARRLFRDSGSLVELTNPSAIATHVDAVHQTIYLLFNEGYHGSESEQTIRENLCYEALRLALLLSEHCEGAKPRTHALLALLCFQAARLPGRIADHGALVQLEMQDRSKWDQDLIGRGVYFLEKSATGRELSEYHLQAAIAPLHCAAATYEQTDWVKILKLYANLIDSSLHLSLR